MYSSSSPHHHHHLLDRRESRLIVGIVSLWGTHSPQRSPIGSMGWGQTLVRPIFYLWMRLLELQIPSPHERCDVPPSAFAPRLNHLVAASPVPRRFLASPALVVTTLYTPTPEEFPTYVVCDGGTSKAGA